MPPRCAPLLVLAVALLAGGAYGLGEDKRSVRLPHGMRMPILLALRLPAAARGVCSESEWARLRFGASPLPVPGAGCDCSNPLASGAAPVRDASGVVYQNRCVAECQGAVGVQDVAGGPGLFG